jgi:exosortase F-associated protein
MGKITSYIFVLLLFLVLVMVRAFEGDLFYDPLIQYFQNDYLYKSMPELDRWKLVVDLLYRYVINSLVSLAIIWLLFKRKDYVKFSGFFLMLIFMILILVFVIVLRDNFENGYLLPFYIRRFIIHPLFLLVLLPAFYYQKLSKR